MPPVNTTTRPTWPVWPAMTLSTAPVSLLAVALFIFATITAWRYRQRCIKDSVTPILEPDPKLISMSDDIYNPILYLPSPPGSIVFSSPIARGDLFSILNSGHLAAKADRERQALRQAAQTHAKGPWRRHSYPAQSLNWDGADSKAESNTLNGDLEFVRRDSLVHFADPDLNGIWRRRILEFENR